MVWTTALAQELGEEDVRGRAGNCGGTKRERALGAGEQQGAVTAWKYKCCPFLQGRKTCIQILNAVDFAVCHQVHSLFM